MLFKRRERGGRGEGWGVNNNLRLFALACKHKPSHPASLFWGVKLIGCISWVIVLHALVMCYCMKTRLLYKICMKLDGTISSVSIQKIGLPTKQQQTKIGAFLRQP